ncbi:PAS domain S-box protein [bacterium]|nr:PAS domain S-box protein [bacterium]
MPRRIGRRLVARSRKLIPILLLQLLMVTMVALLAWGSWSVRRAELISDAKRRALLQGNLISAMHGAMLNSFSMLARDLGTVQSFSSMESGERRATEALLSSFITTNMTFDRVFVLNETNKAVLSIRREGNTILNHTTDSGTPLWVDMLPEDMFEKMESDGFLIEHLDNCGFGSSTHAYLAGLPIYNPDGSRTGSVLFINKFGLFANWFLGISSTDEIHDFLLDCEGRNMIVSSDTSDQSGVDRDIFLREYEKEYEQLRAGEEYIKSRNGIFIAHPIAWTGPDTFDPWTSKTLRSLSWTIVEVIPAYHLRDEQWASIRLLILFGVLLDGLATWLLISSLRARRERLVARNRVNQLNETLTSIINGAPLSIIVLDRRGTVLHWNSAAEKMFGWKAEEVIGRYNPIVNESQNSEFEELFEETITRQQPVEKNVFRTHRDGHMLELHLWTTPISFIDGRASAILGILADVSEQNRRQKAESHAKEIEAARMMARTVAHEFRQPLRALSIMAELAELRGFDAVEVNKTIKLVPKIIRRMDGLVDKLLNLSEIHDKTYWRDINIIDLEGNDPVPYSPPTEPGQN